MTTWQQTRINKNTGKVQHIRKVLDFIAIENQYKHILTNSRSYQGTMCISDHRLLVTTMKVDLKTIHKNKNQSTRNKNTLIDTQKLVENSEIQTQYKEALHEKINNAENKKWNNLTNIIQDTAKTVVGLRKPRKRKIKHDE